MNKKYDPLTDLVRQSYCDEIKLQLDKAIKRPTGENILQVYDMLYKLGLYDYVVKRREE